MARYHSGMSGAALEDAGRALVEGLERRRAPDAVVDAPARRLSRRDHGVAVDAPAPADVAERRCTSRATCTRAAPRPGRSPAAGASTRGRGPPVVPDHRGGAEADPPARVLEPPADVHVVAGHPERRVESTDRRERRAPERHVAARDVLGLGVRQQHVDRARPGRCATRVGRPAGRPSAVRFGPPTAASPVVRNVQARCVSQSRIGIGVVVEVGHDLARRGLPADVPRGAQARVRAAR